MDARLSLWDTDKEAFDLKIGRQVIGSPFGRRRVLVHL